MGRASVRRFNAGRVCFNTQSAQARIHARGGVRLHGRDAGARGELGCSCPHRTPHICFGHVVVCGCALNKAARVSLPKMPCQKRLVPGLRCRRMLRESMFYVAGAATPHIIIPGFQTPTFWVPPGMRSMHPHKCHLCGLIERVPGGTRENVTVWKQGLWRAAAAGIACALRPRLGPGAARRRVGGRAKSVRAGAWARPSRSATRLVTLPPAHVQLKPAYSFALIIIQIM